MHSRALSQPEQKHDEPYVKPCKPEYCICMYTQETGYRTGFYKNSRRNLFLSNQSQSRCLHDAKYCSVLPYMIRLVYHTKKHSGISAQLFNFGKRGLTLEDLPRQNKGRNVMNSLNGAYSCNHIVSENLKNIWCQHHGAAKYHCWNNPDLKNAITASSTPRNFTRIAARRFFAEYVRYYYVGNLRIRQPTY